MPTVALPTKCRIKSHINRRCQPEANYCVVVVVIIPRSHLVRRLTVSPTNTVKSPSRITRLRFRSYTPRCGARQGSGSFLGAKNRSSQINARSSILSGSKIDTIFSFGYGVLSGVGLSAISQISANLSRFRRMFSIASPEGLTSDSSDFSFATSA